MNILKKLKRSIVFYHLSKGKIPLTLWHDAIKKMPMINRYSRHERVKLRVLATQILRKKKFHPVQGMQLTDEIVVMLATQVAIVIYGLETPEKDLALDWIRNWHKIIIYPAAFRNGRENLIGYDGFLVSWAGVESGETSYQGEIVIDWHDNRPHELQEHANQVLMHELAHKLDMLDGYVNGHPPLHSKMSETNWLIAFEDAYEQLNLQISHGKQTAINPYAATSPAEFFAVATEYFFEAPQTLHKIYPKVYEQLVTFYRQNPLKLNDDFKIR